MEIILLYLEGLETNNEKNLSQDKKPSDRDLNPELAKYEKGKPFIDKHM